MNLFFNITQLIFLVFLFFFIAQFFPKFSWLRKGIITLGLVLAGFQLSSVLIGDSLIDYKYYQQFSFGIIGEMAGFYWKEAIVLIAAFLIPVGVLFRLDNYLQTNQFVRGWKALVLALLCGTCLFLNEGMVDHLKEISEVHFAKQVNQQTSLDALGLTTYVPKSKITASPGKNIVFLALESVELGYFQDDLVHLIPNLKRLSEEYTFRRMEAEIGSDNTISALYTYFTGLPMFFKKHGNNVFANARNIKLNSIPHVLKKAGYEQLYLLGNAEFAGMKNMFELMGIEVKSEKNYDPKYYTYYWGLHDKDLFDLAKVELEDLIDKQKPFAFYCSTISTHHPNGVLDARIANTYPEQKSDLELMLTALDNQIASLIDFLKEKGALENTIFYIVPDHLLMGNSARVLNDFDYDRALYILSNMEASLLDSIDKIYPIDLAPIILSGAGVQHNAQFLSDFISGDKPTFVKKHRTEFVQLNEAFVDFKLKPSKTQNLKKQTKDPKKIYIQSTAWTNDDHGESVLHLGTKSIRPKRGVNVLIYNDGRYDYKVFDTYKNPNQVDSLYSELQQVQEQQKYCILFVHNSAGDEIKKQADRFRQLGFYKLSSLANRQAYLSVSKHGIVSEARTNDKITYQFPLKPFESVNDTKTVLDRCSDPHRFIAHAGGMIDKRTYTNCLEALNHSYDNGFKLFELDILKTSDDQYVCAHDWESWKRKVGYEGKVPVDLKTFMKYKIHEKYTPLDLSSLNKWFKHRSDAILVTDKLNEPIPFIKAFDHKDRLMMELFSFDAIENAQSVGLHNCIMSETMVQYLGKDPVNKLNQLGVEYLAVSQNTIRNNKNYYKKLHEGGIKTFAFHVNQPQLRDEAYICRELMDVCYGLYADKWQIPH